MQEEQKGSSCFFMQLQQPAGKGDRMAKFLNYEDRLDIESGLKEHMTFTELGEKLGRDRTTITKEIRRSVSLSWVPARSTKSNKHLIHTNDENKISSGNSPHLLCLHGRG